MISAEMAVWKARRDLALGTALRWALIGLGVSALVAELAIGGGMVVPGVLLGVAAAWMVLSVLSVRGTRMAADSSSLIAAGQYDLAEEQLAQALGRFSIYRASKLMGLHHLAMLRHAQSRWHESAVLCRALLGERLGALAGLSRSSRLILAESLLELGDLRGVYENLARLYDQRLSLREALQLLVVQTDYLCRIGAWEQMMSSVRSKVDLAELLPTDSSARVQAILSLAARRTGRHDWHDWLRRRVDLMVDPARLCANKAVLWEVWQK